MGKLTNGKLYLMEQFCFFSIIPYSAMDPELCFGNIVDKFFITLLVCTLSDLLIGEWRVVTETGKFLF
jgi:hypothetical protein